MPAFSKVSATLLGALGSRPPESILVRGVNWLGDAVMSTPALLRLRERFPASRIGLLTPEKLADLWRGHPAVDVVFAFRPDEQPWHIARQVRRERFEVGLVFPNSPRSALELWLARVPIRIGYRRPWRTWFLTHPIPRRPEEVTMRKRKTAEVLRLSRALAAAQAPATFRVFAGPPSAAHQLHLYLHLAGAAGAKTEPIAPMLRLSRAERAGAGGLIARLAALPSPTADRAWLALNAGAEYGPAKRWPQDRFVAAAREIGQRTGARWLVLGGPNEVELARGICACLPEAVSLAGRTELRDLMQVLSVCRLLLTNDSGPAHVAAALGVPVVAIFGSTSPELTAPGFPGDPRHRILQSTMPCNPCFRRECPIGRRCMEGIEVEAVVSAVIERMGGDSGAA